MPRAKKLPLGRTYAQMRAELDEILAWFESQEADIDEALVRYEKAAQLIAEIEAYLKTAENKLNKLNVKFK